MKNTITKSILISALLALSASSQAGIIKTFIYDDLSMWSNTSNLVVNDSLSINFEDFTDFNNVLSSNILGFQYNLAAGTTEWYDISDFYSFGNGGDFSNVFETNGNEVMMNYSNSMVGYIQASNRIYAQIVPGQHTHIYSQYRDEDGNRQVASTVNLNSNVSYSTVSVPEPSTLAIFALGMIGLASRLFKKQS